MIPAPTPPISTPRIPPQLQRASMESLQQLAPVEMHVEYNSQSRPQYILPQSSSESIRGATPVQMGRQRSSDDEDPSKRVRPAGARENPNSPAQSLSQLSIESEGPYLHPTTLQPLTITPPPLQRLPLHPQNRWSGDDTSIFVSDRSAARLSMLHQRNVSVESIIPARGDTIMLFPGSVRAAGYALQAGTESTTSLHSTMGASRAPG